MGRIRLDHLLVSRGLVEGRSRARSAPDVVEEQRAKLAEANGGKAKLLAALERLAAMG